MQLLSSVIRDRKNLIAEEGRAEVVWRNAIGSENSGDSGDENDSATNANDDSMLDPRLTNTEDRDLNETTTATNHHQANNPAWTITDALENLGRVFNIDQIDPDNETKNDEEAAVTLQAPIPVIPVPQSSIFLHRGDSLSLLNFYEYLALVTFIPKHNDCNEVFGLKQAQSYPMNSKFEAANFCHHVLKLKHATPLLSGKIPCHPGKEPSAKSTSATKSRWAAQANKYARYYLTLFRPETIEDDFGYEWKDLNTYIRTLQEDRSFLSKCRLMIMDNHMHGLRVSKVCDAMMKHHRGKNRRLWTAEERARFAGIHFASQSITSKSISDVFEAAEGSALTAEELKEVSLQIHHDEQQNQAIEDLLAKVPAPPLPTVPYPVSSKFISSLSTEQVYEKAAALRSFSQAPRDIKQKPSKQLFLHHKRLKVKQLTARNAEAASQQLQFYSLYSDYFSQVGLAPPQITLLHGGPGVGKSKLREAIASTNAFCGNYNLKTAFNAINAAEMQGVTTATLIYKEGGQRTINFQGDFRATVKQDLINNGLTVSAVVFIEEVSTQAPWHIAQLSQLCQEILPNTSKDFGGCHVILIGDFTQLGPVKAGKTIPQALFEAYGSREIKDLLSNRSTKRRKRPPPSDPSYKDHTSSLGKGIQILRNCKWFELNKQQRAITDTVHTKFIEDTYHGIPIALDRIKDHINLLSKDDLGLPDWISAPVLVSTNRERFSLTHPRAVHFAKHNGTVVIRWLTDFKDWQNQPPSQYRYGALQDPCFYEYFVPGAEGFVTKNIAKDASIVNGTKFRYHSLLIDPEWEQSLRDSLKHSKPGDVITLQHPPQAVNIAIEKPHGIAEHAWNHLATTVSVVPATKNSTFVVIPITMLKDEWPEDSPNKSTKKQRKRFTPVHGTADFSPSRVLLRKLFPIMPAFAITVHKAEGATLPKVIIAMSHSPVHKCNFTYEQVHVAFSRVTSGNNIRLLLSGKSEMEQWHSIGFVSDLRQDPTIRWFFMGFRPRLRPSEGDPNENWMSNCWCPKRANDQFRVYLEMQ